MSNENYSQYDGRQFSQKLAARILAVVEGLFDRNTSVLLLSKSVIK